MSHSATLTWVAPVSGDPVSSYNIKRSSSPTGPFTTVASVDAPNVTYIDLDVKPGEVWSYEVTSVNSKGESVPCAVVTALVIPFSVPDAPTGLVVTVA